MTQIGPKDAIDAKIAVLGDWRGEILARVRALIPLNTLLSPAGAAA